MAAGCRICPCRPRQNRRTRTLKSSPMPTPTTGTRLTRRVVPASLALAAVGVQAGRSIPAAEHLPRMLGRTRMTRNLSASSGLRLENAVTTRRSTRMLLIVSAAAVVALACGGSPTSPTASPSPSPAPVPASAPAQSQVTGIAKRILHGDGNGTATMRGHTGTVADAVQIPISADGTFSGMVKSGDIYDLTIAGNGYRDTPPVPIRVDQPTHMLGPFWLIDGDDPSPGSQHQFLWSVFEGVSLRGVGLLYRWDKNVRLRVYRGNWDTAASVGGVRGSLQGIIDEVTSGVRDAVTRMACGALQCIRIETIEYVEGSNPQPLTAATDNYINIYAINSRESLDGPAYGGFRTGQSREIIGGYVHINVLKNDFVSLRRTAAHETGHVLGMEHETRVPSIMSPIGGYDIQQIDENNGKVAYSLPLGFTTR